MCNQPANKSRQQFILSTADNVFLPMLFNKKHFGRQIMPVFIEPNALNLTPYTAITSQSSQLLP